MKILKTEEHSGGLNTGDQVGQVEVRVQALEGLAQNIAGPKTSPAPGLPEGFDSNAVAHLAWQLGQVKSYFEGRLRTSGQNMNALMAQLQEEDLRPRGVNPMDRGYYPDRGEWAPRGPFGGYFFKPLQVSDAAPSNPFIPPQRNRPDGFHHETHRSDGVSDHRVSTHDGMPPTRNRDPNADFRHCRGIGLRIFYDKGKFKSGAIEDFPKGEQLPKVKPTMGPLPGFALSEAPTPQCHH